MDESEKFLQLIDAEWLAGTGLSHKIPAGENLRAWEKFSVRDNSGKWDLVYTVIGIIAPPGHTLTADEVEFIGAQWSKSRTAAMKENDGRR